MTIIKLGILLGVLFMVSCGSGRHVITTKKEHHTYEKKPENKVFSQKQLPSEIAAPLPVTVPKSYAETVTEYIEMYKEISKKEMKKYGIPASITLAQGILESGAGKGALTMRSNNHFGIKCHKGWQGGKTYHDDDRKGECFRTYEDPEDSYKDHSLFLKERSRYHFLFTLPKNDYVAWAKGLRKAGYATDRKYPKKLIGIIERYQLYRYDSDVLQESPQWVSTSNPITQVHVVKEGDTLYAISRQYGITVKELMEINNLDTTIISIGQTLNLSSE